LHCRTLRQNLRLSQKKFAERMGIANKVGKITVSRWESGTIPQKRYLIKFLALQKQYDRRKG